LREASRARNASRPTHMFVHVYVCVCVCAHSAGEVVDEAASTEDEVVAKVMSTAEEVVAETVSMVDEVVAESASTMDKVAAEAASTVNEVVATASNAHARSSSLPHRRVAGKFYRAEKDLLLQGILAPAAGTASVRVELGPCPVADYKSAARCPAHDPNCGCHGPVMTRGMVGWAGGGGGPDFFINTFAKPVDWWERQHTIWGEIRDEASLKVVESSYGLPAHNKGMRMLDREIEFTLELF